MYSIRLCVLLLASLIPSGSGLTVSKLLGEHLRLQAGTSLLRIQLQESEIPGNVRALITNRGSIKAYFSTWRNPLSSDDYARKLNVVTANDEFIQLLRAEGFVMKKLLPKIMNTYQRASL